MDLMRFFFYYLWLIIASFAVGAKDYSLFQSFYSASGAHRVSFFFNSYIGLLPRNYGGRGTILTTYFHLVSKFRMSGAMPPLLLHSVTTRTRKILPSSYLVVYYSPFH